MWRWPLMRFLLGVAYLVLKCHIFNELCYIDEVIRCMKAFGFFFLWFFLAVDFLDPTSDTMM